MLTTPPPEKNIVKKYSQGKMLPLETKHSGGKLLPHSDLRGRVFLGEVSRSRKRDIFLGTWNVRSLYKGMEKIVWVVKSRRMRWAGHVARMGEGRGVHRVLVGKPEGKRPLGRPRRRWEDNIKMVLQEVGGGGD